MERKGDSKFSFSTWLKDNWLYFLAFLLPVLSMLIVYFFKDIAPFGDQMYLPSVHTISADFAGQVKRRRKLILYLGNRCWYELCGYSRLLFIKSF